MTTGETETIYSSNKRIGWTAPVKNGFQGEKYNGTCNANCRYIQREFIILSEDEIVKDQYNIGG